MHTLRVNIKEAKLKLPAMKTFFHPQNNYKQSKKYLSLTDRSLAQEFTKCSLLVKLL